MRSSGEPTFSMKTEGGEQVGRCSSSRSTSSTIGFDLEQGQGVELVEQVVDDLDAVVGGDDGEGFVLLGQRHAGSSRGGGEGETPGMVSTSTGTTFAHDAGEVAEGGEGGGIAFDQEDEIAAFAEQFDRLLTAARAQALARMSASRVIGKTSSTASAGTGMPPRSTMDRA